MNKVAKGEGRLISQSRRKGVTRMLIEVEGTFTPTDNHLFFLTDPKRKTLRQINFFHALCADIGSFMGESAANVKEKIKQAAEVESVADSDRNVMADLIDYTIEFCKEHEVPLKQKTVQQMDAEHHVEICMHYKVCLICGRPADIHHLEAIGMGRDRDKVDATFPSLRKIPLCRRHHVEIETTGVNHFMEKYLLEDYAKYLKGVK